MTELALGAGSAGGTLPPGTLQTRTDFGAAGYGGPCPPEGDHPHRYLFTVHAVGTDKLNATADTSAAVIGFQLHFNTLAKASIMGLFKRYAEHNGIDPHIGRRLPRMLREVARLVEISVRPIVHVYPVDHERRFIAADFAENVAERLVDQKLAGAREISSLLTRLRSHLNDPDTLVVSHLFFQAWGRKPADAAG